MSEQLSNQTRWCQGTIDIFHRFGSKIVLPRRFLTHLTSYLYPLSSLTICYVCHLVKRLLPSVNFSQKKESRIQYTWTFMICTKQRSIKLCTYLGFPHAVKQYLLEIFSEMGEETCNVVEKRFFFLSLFVLTARTRGLHCWRNKWFTAPESVK